MEENHLKWEVMLIGIGETSSNFIITGGFNLNMYSHGHEKMALIRSDTWNILEDFQIMFQVITELYFFSKLFETLIHIIGINWKRNMGQHYNRNFVNTIQGENWNDFFSDIDVNKVWEKHLMSKLPQNEGQHKH